MSAPKSVGKRKRTPIQRDLFGVVFERPMRSDAMSKAARDARAAQDNRLISLQVVGLLNVHQAAYRLGASKSTLDKMRRAKKGPRFIKITDRSVRYDPAALDAWIVARRNG